MTRGAIRLLYGLCWLDIILWTSLIFLWERLGMHFRDLLMVWYCLAILAVFWCVYIPLRVPRVWRTFLAGISLHCSVLMLLLTVLGSVAYVLGKQGIEMRPIGLVGIFVVIASQILTFLVIRYGSRKTAKQHSSL